MLLDTYKKLPYTGEINSETSQLKNFKFESPFHFVSFIEEIHKKGIRDDKSNNSSEERDNGFSESRSLDHAFEIFRTAKYSPENGKKTSLLVNKLRHKSGYFDEGDEISIPEFLAGSEKHFLQFGSERTKVVGHTFKIPLIIKGSYNAGNNANEILEGTRLLIDSIYRNKFKFSKVIFCFSCNSGYRDGSRFECFVDVNYTDFNSIARLIHPATFRRLTFRLQEMHRDLSSGYGSSPNEVGSLEEGLHLPEFVRLKAEEVDKKIIKIVKDYLKK